MNFKQLAKAGAKRLPTGFTSRLQNGLFHALPAEHQLSALDRYADTLGAWRVVSRLAPRAGITAVVASGQYGDMQSSPLDTVSLPVYAQTGTWSPRTTGRFAALFEARGGTYLDVGANIGLTTVPLARNPKVTCIAFEPEPVNFHHLSANVARNCPHGNVVLHQVALFARSDTLQFQIASEHIGDHRLRLSDASGAWGEGRRPFIEVRAVPLREIVTAFDRPLGVKIDTQGAEPFVVEGGLEMLAEADLLSIEFWPYGMAYMGADPEIVIALVAGFDTVTVSPGEGGDGKTLSGKEAAAVLRSLAKDPTSTTDYFDVVASRR